MNATTDFYLWFYTGLNGLGGWFIFFLFALSAVVWLLYDSQTRKLPAAGWKLGIVILAALIIPAIMFRFAGSETQLSLEQFTEVIFYLGLLGGVLPPTLAVGYFVTYRDMVGCPNGHVYDIALGECPECVPMGPSFQSFSPPNYGGMPQMNQSAPPIEPQYSGAPLPPSKPKAHAWLSAQSGRSYQLNQGETSIGRATQNDIQISGDTTIGRQHAKIQEANGRFRLVDLGSRNGTFLNSRPVRQPVILEPDDEIRFGDNTIMRFITSSR